MMRRLLDFLSPSWDAAKRWVDRHPRMARALERTGSLRFERRAVARGVGVGLFIALTPTVGIQIVMMLGACLLVRGNFLAAFVVSWISNPVTMAPLYVGYHALGERIFSPIIETGLHLAGYGEKVALEVTYVALGSLVVAIPAAIAGYALLLWGWRTWIIQRRKSGFAVRRLERAAEKRDERARNERLQDDKKGQSDDLDN